MKGTRTWLGEGKDKSKPNIITKASNLNNPGFKDAVNLFKRYSETN
jgi:hypothetical protein